MHYQNCWEFKKCGREKKNEKGICPAAVERRANNVNGGLNGGRVCWAIAGTYCDETVQGTYAEKLLTCLICDFRIKVWEEQGYKFKLIYL